MEKRSVKRAPLQVDLRFLIADFRLSVSDMLQLVGGFKVLVPDLLDPTSSPVLAPAELHVYRHVGFANYMALRWSAPLDREFKPTNIQLLRS